jgi:hypothetical protein
MSKDDARWAVVSGEKVLSSAAQLALLRRQPVGQNKLSSEPTREARDWAVQRQALAPIYLALDYAIAELTRQDLRLKALLAAERYQAPSPTSDGRTNSTEGKRADEPG